MIYRGSEWRDLRHGGGHHEPCQERQAIRPHRRRGAELAKLKALLEETDKSGDLATWKRAKAVMGYIDGRKVIALKDEVGVDRSAVNKWLRWYDVAGAASPPA